VIDAIDLALAEDGAYEIVDGSCRGPVLPERLFQHHAGFRRHQLRGRKIRAGRREQAGRHRQEHHAHHVLAPCQRLGEALEIRRGGGVRAHVFDEAAEGFPPRRREFVLTQEFPEILAHLLEVLRGREIRARHGENLRAGGNLARCNSAVHGAHELAHGEVAGGAKQNDVERIGLLVIRRRLGVCHGRMIEASPHYFANVSTAPAMRSG
jgi:hypothetical protein